MYNLVKGMWNKLTKKEEPDLTDPDVPILDVPILDVPILDVPVLDVPVLDVPVSEVVYIVLNDFEMETMADDDVPVEKKKDPVIVLDLVSNVVLDPIVSDPIVLDPIVLDPIAEEEAIILNEEEVKKPKKAKKLKKA